MIVRALAFASTWLAGVTDIRQGHCWILLRADPGFLLPRSERASASHSLSRPQGRSLKASVLGGQGFCLY